VRPLTVNGGPFGALWRCEVSFPEELSARPFGRGLRTDKTILAGASARCVGLDAYDAGAMSPARFWM
jgi:hypothetical protein